MTVLFHAFANLFPLLEGSAREDLRRSLAETGQIDRIVLHQARILDGRNRYLACLDLGRAPEWTVFGWPLPDPPPGYVIEACLAGRALTPRECARLPAAAAHLAPDFPRAGIPGDALAHVVAINLHRRHLTESQRAMIAAGMANLRHGGDRRSDQAATLPVVRQPDAARAVGVSERLVRSAARVLRAGAPELVEAARRGAIDVSAAARAARLEPEIQRAIAAEAAGNPRVIGLVVKRHDREAREARLGSRIRALPEKRFGVILADPEWEHEAWGPAGTDRSPENHYPTSTVEAIAARPVGSIAAEDCACFLWVPANRIPAGVKVLDAWGFRFVASWAWVKPDEGTGFWLREQHELLLLGTRGDVPCPAPGTQWSSVIFAPRGAEHSAKPDDVLRMIEAYFPTLPKIELNARRRRPGWDAWGLEAPDEAAA